MRGIGPFHGRASSALRGRDARLRPHPPASARLQLFFEDYLRRSLAESRMRDSALRTLASHPTVLLSSQVAWFSGVARIFHGFSSFFTQFSRVSAVVFVGCEKTGCFFIFFGRRNYLPRITRIKRMGKSRRQIRYCSCLAGVLPGTSRTRQLGPASGCFTLFRLVPPSTGLSFFGHNLTAKIAENTKRRSF
jgi:hypothetical protein